MGGADLFRIKIFLHKNENINVMILFLGTSVFWHGNVAHIAPHKPRCILPPHPTYTLFKRVTKFLKTRAYL